MNPLFRLGIRQKISDSYSIFTKHARARGEPMNVIVSGEGPINRFNCEKHGEFVIAALLLPKGLLEFVEDVKSCFNGTVEKYLSETLIDSVRAQIESDNMFRPTVKSVSEKYGVNFDC